LSKSEAGVATSPYRGLLAFREQDAPVFFGREAFTHELERAVRDQPLVAVVGPSGSGKSSVVFFGREAFTHELESCSDCSCRGIDRSRKE
jgi:hypothetical protein